MNPICAWQAFFPGVDVPFDTLKRYDGSIEELLCILSASVGVGVVQFFFWFLLGHLSQLSQFCQQEKSAFATATFMDIGALQCVTDMVSRATFNYLPWEVEPPPPDLPT